MTKVLILYYSSYGHIQTMAAAVAEGVRETGSLVDVKRVPELVPESVAQRSGYKVDLTAPIAKVSCFTRYGECRLSRVICWLHRANWMTPSVARMVLSARCAKHRAPRIPPRGPRIPPSA